MYKQYLSILLLCCTQGIWTSQSNQPQFGSLAHMQELLLKKIDAMASSNSQSETNILLQQATNIITFARSLNKSTFYTEGHDIVNGHNGNKGRIPLLYVIGHNRLTKKSKDVLIAFLCAHGADVCGETPLDYAIHKYFRGHCSLESISTLFHYGAQANDIQETTKQQPAYSMDHALSNFKKAKAINNLYKEHCAKQLAPSKTSPQDPELLEASDEEEKVNDILPLNSFREAYAAYYYKLDYNQRVCHAHPYGQYRSLD